MNAQAEKTKKVSGAGFNAAWPLVPLGQIADIKLGKMLDKNKPSTGRRLPYLRNINVRWGRVDTDDLLEMPFDDDQLDRFGLKAGDVLVCEGGEPGRAAVWDGHMPDLKFQKAIHRVRFKSHYEPRLLALYLELLAQTGGLERRFTGSTIKHFTREAFVQLPVPLISLPDQRRIVAEIEQQFTRLDAGVAALRRTQANLKRYRAAVLKAACEGRLVPTDAELTRADNRIFETGEALLTRILAERRQNWRGRSKYSEPAAPIIGDDLDRLPEGWEMATVEQLSNKVQYGHTASAIQRSTGVRFLRITDIQDRCVEWESVPSCDISEDDIEELSLLPGDLVFARTGATVGKSYLLKAPFPKSVFASYLIRISPAGEYLSRWFQTFFDSPSYWNQIRESSSGIGQPNVNGTKLQAMQIPLPPLAEQTRIVAEVERRLSVVDELESLVKADLQRATRLRQSILQKAFTGELVA